MSLQERRPSGLSFLPRGAAPAPKPVARSQSAPITPDKSTPLPSGAVSPFSSTPEPGLNGLQRTSSMPRVRSCPDFSQATPEDRAKHASQKITDILRKAVAQRSPVYSFEYFPPKTTEGEKNLLDRISRMMLLNPSWVDMTWTNGPAYDPRKKNKTLLLSSYIVKSLGLPVMMHVSMTGMRKAQIISVLDNCKEAGIRNILALRGDPAPGCDFWEPVDDNFEHAVDLVRLIRERYGDYFSIGVGGYPDVHIDAQSMEKDVGYLKAKVDAGADFIVTQLFYDIGKFRAWKQACRAAGIKVPIIPGIMPIHTYNTFARITAVSRVTVPPQLSKKLRPIRDNDAHVKDYGITYATKMMRELMQDGDCPCFHFYTLNLERSVGKVLERVGLVGPREKKRRNSRKRSPSPGKKSPVALPRPLPFLRSSSLQRRKTEDVRPIFWQNRSASYEHRTLHWDEFPNGRWGDNRSPAYAATNSLYFMTRTLLTKSKRRKLWGECPKTEQDVSDVFVNFLLGKISLLPWCLEPIRPETNVLLEQLMLLNKAGILTINSQPRVNGCPSDDSRVGWGEAGGYVYQKAYLEFFCSEDVVSYLLEQAKLHPTLTYHCTNRQGANYTNAPPGSVNAVTWGVFPGKEISQPTVVDPKSFMVWKAEAFDIWKNMWCSCYEPGSESRKFMDGMNERWWLVNIVDNDFVMGNIFRVFLDMFKAYPDHPAFQSLGPDMLCLERKWEIHTQPARQEAKLQEGTGYDACSNTAHERELQPTPPEQTSKR